MAQDSLKSGHKPPEADRWNPLEDRGTVGEDPLAGQLDINQTSLDKLAVEIKRHMEVWRDSQSRLEPQLSIPPAVEIQAFRETQPSRSQVSFSVPEKAPAISVRPSPPPPLDPGHVVNAVDTGREPSFEKRPELPPAIPAATVAADLAATARALGDPNWMDQGLMGERAADLPPKEQLATDQPTADQSYWPVVMTPDEGEENWQKRLRRDTDTAGTTVPPRRRKAPYLVVAAMATAGILGVGYWNQISPPRDTPVPSAAGDLSTASGTVQPAIPLLPQVTDNLPREVETIEPPVHVTPPTPPQAEIAPVAPAPIAAPVATPSSRPVVVVESPPVEMPTETPEPSPVVPAIDTTTEAPTQVETKEAAALPSAAPPKPAPLVPSADAMVVKPFEPGPFEPRPFEPSTVVSKLKPFGSGDNLPKSTTVSSDAWLKPKPFQP